MKAGDWRALLTMPPMPEITLSQMGTAAGTGLKRSQLRGVSVVQTRAHVCSVLSICPSCPYVHMSSGSASLALDARGVL